MGSIIPWPTRSKPRLLQIEVHGTGEIDTIYVIKNNKEFRCISIRDEDALLDVIDTTPADHGDYYYIRVVQTDDHHAWSSPIWME